MEDQNIELLKRAIDELSIKEAPDVWSNIEHGLVEEENTISFKDAIEQLPTKEAPDVWLSIEASLPRKLNFRSIWMVAASVVLFLCSVFLFIESNNSYDEPQIAHTTEMLENFNVALDIQSIGVEEDAILQYIQKNCMRLALTCNDPEFKGLLETYIELNEAKKVLTQELEKRENRPQLMKYLIRVEKNQTEIGKDMLKKLRNS